jgi:hypothetical protein
MSASPKRITIRPRMREVFVVFIIFGIVSLSLVDLVKAVVQVQFFEPKLDLGLSMLALEVVHGSGGPIARCSGAQSQ